jgi:hypothetical protein
LSRIQRRLGAVGLAAAVAGAIAVPQAQAAAPTASGGATLYANNMSAACTDAGTGTQAAPYCSVQAAADAATAGDTVSVAGFPGFYGTAYGNLTISKSGTAGAPITFVGTGTTYATIGSLTIDGSYVDVTGLYAYNSGSSAVRENGSHVTLDRDQLGATNGPTAALGASVSDVTISRSVLSDYNGATVVQTATGDSGVQISTDELDTLAGGATVSGDVVSVSGSQGTEITSNTVLGPCESAVGVTGSTGTSVENNVFEGLGSCSDTSPADLSVDPASAASTTADYNELSQMASDVNPYSWAGKTYQTQDAFHSATGQGAHDEVEQYVDPTTGTMPTGAGVADGNPTAPGELSGDLYGNTWPGAAPDRGAVAVEELTGATLFASTVTAQQAGLTLDLAGVPWGSSSTYSVNWGDGQSDNGLSAGGSIPSDFSDLRDTHMYARSGTYPVTVTITDKAQTLTRTTTVTTGGSTYVPVDPTRVLDTRGGIGAPEAKIGPDGTIAVDVTKGVTVPQNLGTISAVVLNLTATDETGNGVITAYPDGADLPEASNVNFAAGRNTPNLATVEVGADDKVDFHNGSTASTDLLADVEGYYVESTAGSYYLPNAPTRVLDTRKGTGGVTGPVGPGATVSLSLPACTSGSGTSKQTATATAVALNITAVGSTANGVVTAYPGGAVLPNASNLNYYTGQTVPNLTVVQVGSDGKVQLHNGSTGTVQLIADLEGCYSATLGGTFVPIAPTRQLDTRSGLGQNSATGIPVAANGNATWVANEETLGSLWNTSAVVMNVTVTDAKASGFITAYSLSPDLPNASNLNFTKGQTVPNLVMVATDGNTPVNLHNISTGTVDLVADLFGYFS